MPIRLRVRRIIGDLNLAAHLAIHTTDYIIASAMDTWRERHHRGRPVSLPRELSKIIRYGVAVAVNCRDYFAVDGDHHGRRPSLLPAHLRQQRRTFAARRRRYVTVLLDALGATPDAVQASLTRHWQIARQESGYRTLVEDYLAARLSHRDPHALPYIDVYPWACNVGGTWTATPRAVRRYLRRADIHERHLAAASTLQPRRGVRMIPRRGTRALGTSPVADHPSSPRQE